MRWMGVKGKQWLDFYHITLFNKTRRKKFKRGKDNRLAIRIKIRPEKCAKILVYSIEFSEA
jgi:hypothetical protein